MTDRISVDARSRNMAQIRGRETKPELALRRMLWSMGQRYRTHARLPGRPDIVFTRDQLAVFVDGCFWHSCPEHGAVPSSNNHFWSKKLRSNQERDRRVESELAALGWTVLRFWEHEVEESALDCARKIVKTLNRRRRERGSVLPRRR